MLALGTEVVEVLDDPLPDALLVEDVPARQKNGLFHVFIADSASQIVELSQLLPLDLF